MASTENTRGWNAVAQHPGFKYRPDIDGLRAIAVLAVVFYHYGIVGLKGGFVGVDVFFVISGYLIAGIIQSEIQRGAFSLARFYERRVRRIFPALFTVLAATLAAGYFLLLPSDLCRLGRSAIATILFVSNVQFMRESGYFDSASDMNPLLHTWSLGVEEQFYLGLPLLLLLVHRIAPKHLGKILAGCALLSFVGCVFIQPKIAKLAFFFSPFRAWELLLGALLGVGVVPAIVSRAVRQWLSLVALGVLLASIAWMHEGVDFPGWKAAIPVLATAALLHAGREGDTHVARLLALRPMVVVGLLSYSLYLWHWPLLVFLRYQQGMAQVTAGQAWGLAVAALAVSAASYYAIEQPLRYWRRRGGIPARRRVFAAGALTSALFLAGAGGLVMAKGLPGRVPPQVLAYDEARSPVIPYKQCDGKPVAMDRTECRIGAPKGDLVLVWGDSWAMAWAPALDEVLRQKGKAGILAVRSACAPLLGVNNRKSPTCIKRNRQVMEWIRQNRPAKVYLIAAWPAWTNAGGYPLDDETGILGNAGIFRAALMRTLHEVEGYVMAIAVLGPAPTAVGDMPYLMAMASWRRRSLPPRVARGVTVDTNQTFWKTANEAASSVPEVEWIDPVPWFCDARHCNYRDARGRLLYRDADHLSLAGAQFVASHLVRADPGASTTKGGAIR